MGLFASRPEDPFEWAGLPSEPLRAQTEAERLDPTPVDPFSLTAGTDVSSVAVPVEPATEDPDRPAQPG